jgi:hypothetical protein
MSDTRKDRMHAKLAPKQAQAMHAPTKHHAVTVTAARVCWLQTAWRSNVSNYAHHVIVDC